MFHAFQNYNWWFHYSLSSSFSSLFFISPRCIFIAASESWFWFAMMIWMWLEGLYFVWSLTKSKKTVFRLLICGFSIISGFNWSFEYFSDRFSFPSYILLFWWYLWKGGVSHLLIIFLVVYQPNLNNEPILRQLVDHSNLIQLGYPRDNYSWLDITQLKFSYWKESSFSEQFLISYGNLDSSHLNPYISNVLLLSLFVILSTIMTLKVSIFELRNKKGW
jgi:hypothetical protein